MSWTDQQGGNSTIRFNGSTVWVNGVGGAEGGSFEVLIDNVSQGMFDASGGPKVFNQIMYFTSGLTEGPHTLSLINRGGRLSFDYLMASSGLVDAATVPIAAPSPVKYVPSSTASLRAETSLTATTISAVPAAATEASNGPSKNVIVGASVGGVLVLLGLILFGLVLFLWCRRRKERHERTGQNEKQPWYKPAKTRRFVALLDGGTSELGYSKHDTLKSDASHLSHTSGSSFGVLANGSSMRLAPPRPAAARDPIHMRRSLLPFKNNLWAKAREEAARAAEDASADQDQDQDFDGPIVPRNTDTLRAHASSPDPMAAALGNVTSPLTQLQRNFSQRAGMKGSGSKSNNLYKSSDNINANIGMNPNSSKAAAPAPADAQLPMFDDMPQVGSREWYQVFGLSPNGNGNGNGNGNSKERTSGFSLFRRSANSAKSGSSGISGSSTMAVRIPSPPPMPNIPSAGPGRAGMLEVDTQYADPQAGYTTGAQERSPRRSFFGRGNQVDSLWARV
jgi:hypothetical protein